MTTTLQYKRINLAKRETRLLEIETGQDIDDPIRCRLVNVKITDDLEFIGLAALWGNPDETEPIWIVCYSRPHSQDNYTTGTCHGPQTHGTRSLIAGNKIRTVPGQTFQRTSGKH